MLGQCAQSPGDRNQRGQPVPFGNSVPWCEVDGCLQREAVELKVWQPRKADPLAQGLLSSPPYLRETSRNSSNPWSCVVTNPPMLGLEMPQLENSTGMLPCTSIVVAVRSAFSVNVTERM